MPFDLREVRLPNDLCAAAEHRFREQFSSLEELLVFILKDLVREEVSELDQAEQRIIEERLKELGYL